MSPQCPRIILLGAGRPYSGSRPTALQEDVNSRRVLDWLFAAFGSFQAEWWFVGGYRIDLIADAYPHLNFVYNTEWATTGPVVSLFAAPVNTDREHFATYTDILVRPAHIEAMRRTPGDIVVLVDTAWRNRYEGRGEVDLRSRELLGLDDEGRFIAHRDARDLRPAEFVGVVLLRLKALSVVRSFKKEGELPPKARLTDLVLETARRECEVGIVDVCGDWAEFNAPQDVARFVLGTKGETLTRLAPLVRRCTIGRSIIIQREEWEGARRNIVAETRDRFRGSRVAVRSSSRSEDAWSESNAGAFQTVLGVDVADLDSLAEAIDRVFESYGDVAGQMPNRDGDQVLVQEMVVGATISGVALTRSLSTGAPYYVINYDDSGGSTDTVTKGVNAAHKTLTVWRECDVGALPMPAFAPRLVVALREIESLVGHDSLDVEFAITGDESVHVLQVRPIAVDHSQWFASDADFRASLKATVSRFRGLRPASSGILGGSTIFGVMPDWNPAEIIGTRPRQLAFTLYRHLVTDEIWATQRAEAGYRDVRPHPLMFMFLGCPYVDVRASLNSFVPNELDPDFAERLVDHYVDRLAANPEMHDKVEFEVAVTCWSPDFDQHGMRLRDAGFTKLEIRMLEESLCGITARAIAGCQAHLSGAQALRTGLDVILSHMPASIDRALLLIDRCQRDGVLPFAHLARSAFMAITFLRGSVVQGILEPTRLREFFKAQRSVTRNMASMARDVALGNASFDEFVGEYGHLRPGTYDITQLSYRSDPDLYLSPLVARANGSQPETVEEEFSWTDEEARALEGILAEKELCAGVGDFTAFLKNAIYGREYAKFEFSRYLSQALDDLVDVGTDWGLSREELSHLSLEDLRSARLGSSSAGVSAALAGRSAEEKLRHDLSFVFEVPPVITKEADFVAFETSGAVANFITMKGVVAAVAKVGDKDSRSSVLEGAIVLIPQADPGYDWLFGRQIAGLITQYGGPNSHMAIRAAELDLPAAIGVGSKLYGQLNQAEIIKLDCAGKVIEAIR